MKIIHSTSKQVIDVPEQHGHMLITQGWLIYKEIEHGLQEKGQKAPEEVAKKPSKRIVK